MGQAIHLTTMRSRLRRVLAAMSFGRVTTACVSSPTDQEVSKGSHMQQNEFFFFLPPLSSGHSETWIKKIGINFLLGAVLHSVFLRVLYAPLDDIMCVSFKKTEKQPVHNISFTFNDSLCFQVASVRTQFAVLSGKFAFQSRHNEVVMCLVDLLDEMAFVWKLPRW